MNDESFELIEQQIAFASLLGSPDELRHRVLADVRRELRASRWDRRLGRVAAVLLMVGVGMNAALGLRSNGIGGGGRVHASRGDTRSSLVDTAIAVAVATDAATARRLVRQLAAMSGRELTADEAAAIDAAVRRQVRS